MVLAALLGIGVGAVLAFTIAQHGTSSRPETYVPSPPDSGALIPPIFRIPPSVDDSGFARGGSVGEIDRQPVPLNHPRPQYTEDARRHKVEGVIQAKVLVATDGRPRDVKVMRHLPDGLDEKAIEAVYQMRFRPATRASEPVAAWITIEVDFNLR